MRVEVCLRWYPCQYNVESLMTRILYHRGVQILLVIGHIIKKISNFFFLRTAKFFTNDGHEERPLRPPKV